jgi:hypothetical protein
MIIARSEVWAKPEETQRMAKNYKIYVGELGKFVQRKWHFDWMKREKIKKWISRS